MSAPTTSRIHVAIGIFSSHTHLSSNPGRKRKNEPDKLFTFRGMPNAPLSLLGMSDGNLISLVGLQLFDVKTVTFLDETKDSIAHAP
jgi:hypothetical protein